MLPVKLIQDFFELVKSVWTFFSLPKKLTELPSKMVEIYMGEGGITSIFTNLGSNLVDGLTGGIKNKWNELKSTISDLTDGVSGWFKEALDILSPSRVFA